MIVDQRHFIDFWWRSVHFLGVLEVHVLWNLSGGSCIGSWGGGELDHSGLLGAVTAVLAWAVLRLDHLLGDGAGGLDVLLEEISDLLLGGLGSLGA